MKILTTWLNEYLGEELSAEQQAAAMERAGIEVEEIIHPPQFAENIVVAAISAIEPHPNADKLVVAKVELPSGSQQVVCGDLGIYVGQKAPYVAPLTTLPGGQVIEAAEIRGVKSNGMLASEHELGLGGDASRVMDLDKDLALGTPLNLVFEAASIDVTVAANRVDLLSVVGIAREVAAHADVEFKQDQAGRDHKLNVASGKAELFSNETGAATPRYLLAKVLLKNNPPSPTWLRQRLLASGVKPLNLAVDITNYVMLEYGQPLHAFDAAKIKTPLSIRYASEGEKLTTLDGVSRSLATSDIVIADTKTPIALAGVMGAADVAVGADTKSLLLEAAVFDAAGVRKSAQRHNLRTEASSRFERALPLEFPLLGLARALELFEELADGVVESAQEAVATEAPARPQITVTLEQLSNLSGVEIEPAVLNEQLPRLGFAVEASGQKDALFKVAPPFWRPDIKQAEDILEEVIKLVGLEELPATLPEWRTSELHKDRQRPFRGRLRNALVGLGLFEVLTYPFVSSQQLELLELDPGRHLKLKNPRSSEQQYLRTTLAPSLLAALAANSRRRENFGFFELARTYQPGQGSESPIEEPQLLGVAVQGPEPYRQVKNVLDNLSRLLQLEFRLEAAQERPWLRPGRQALVFGDSQSLGYIGELHPRVQESLKLEAGAALLELEYAALFELAREPEIEPLPRFPAAKRDVTVIIDSAVHWQDVARLIKESDLARAGFGGDYTGKGVPSGKRALTIQLEFTAPEHTLTDEEVQERLEKLLKLLKQNFKAQLQG